MPDEQIVTENKIGPGHEKCLQNKVKRKGKVLETVGSDDGRKGRSYGEGEGGGGGGDGQSVGTVGDDDGIITMRVVEACSSSVTLPVIYRDFLPHAGET